MWWFLLAMLLLTLVAIYWLLLFVKTLDPAESEAAAAVPVDGHSALDRIVRHYRRTAAAAADRRPPFPSKELIMAMAQRKVYSWTTSAGNPQADGGGGDDDDDDTGRWAREFIAASCARLDAVQPDTLALECAVHEFCDRVNRVLDDEQARLCEINETLSTVTVARAALEDEVFKATGCVDPGASRPPDGDDCWTPRPEPHPSYPCPEADAAADDEEEDALSAVYGQLVNDLERVTAAYVVSTAAQADRDVPDGSDGPEDGDDEDDDREDDPENDREDDGGPAESRGSSAVRSS